jgi:hypothetical protein
LAVGLIAALSSSLNASGSSAARRLSIASGMRSPGARAKMNTVSSGFTWPASERSSSTPALDADGRDVAAALGVGDAPRAPSARHPSRRNQREDLAPLRRSRPRSRPFSKATVPESDSALTFARVGGERALDQRLGLALQALPCAMATTSA